MVGLSSQKDGIIGIRHADNNVWFLDLELQDHRRKVNGLSIVERNRYQQNPCCLSLGLNVLGNGRAIGRVLMDQRKTDLRRLPLDLRINPVLDKF